MEMLPVFILDNAVLFPGVLLPLRLQTTQHFQTLEKALSQHDRMVFTGLKKIHKNKLEVENVGCVGRVAHVEQGQNKGDYFLEVLIEGVQVSNIKESYFNSDTFSGLIHKSEDFALDWVIRKNRLKELKRVTNLYLDAHQQAKYYIRKLRTEIDDEELIALYILTFLFQDPKPKQQILEIRDPIKRINKIKDLLSILYLKQVDLEHLDPS